jgi:hypothetical protein
MGEKEHFKTLEEFKVSFLIAHGKESESAKTITETEDKGIPIVLYTVCQGL